MKKSTLLPSLMLNLPSAELPVPCQKNIPSADRKQLTLKDLNEEPIVLCEPDRCAEAIAQLQGHLLASHSHSPSQIYFGEI